MVADTPENRRFAFGANWRRYAKELDEAAIHRAELSVCTLLDVEDLKGRSFLDVGSGSGLFSLAARRLGASVLSFDYDPESVAVTESLRARHKPDKSGWRIERGSALDANYLAGLGQFEIVYAWGVLHHTGDMWTALGNVAGTVAPSGTLAIAIYNDQGPASRRWVSIKRAYNRLPKLMRFVILWPALLRLWGPCSVRDILAGRGFSTWRDYRRERGMSPWRDVVDWVGGWPFEVATPDAIVAFFAMRGFTLLRSKTVGRGHGCNEFVFRRT
ncbi:MAG TPA: methyltransferase domain-containing protein [Stellaceae bacterium]|nr:methyltransferase domain-containing protein [Stellaceae bacterium]